MTNVEFAKSKMLIGELDSARTAALHDNDWWRTPSEYLMNSHIVNGEALAILELLLGQIMVLPRNQYFDSKPWFEIVQTLVKLPIPTFAITLFGGRVALEPDALIDDVANQFEAIQGEFALSAWPELAQEQRKRIACNIRLNGDFKKMFANVTPPYNRLNEFQGQQAGLQLMYEYLKKHYRTIPGLITRSFSEGNPRMWERLEADSNDPRLRIKLESQFNSNFAGEYIRLLMAIPAEAEEFVSDQKAMFNETHYKKFLLDWLDKRTNLYQVIGKYPKEFRNWLRLHIDWQYNKRLSISATGTDALSNADRADSGFPFLARVEFADTLEEANEKTPIDQEYIGIYDELHQGEKLFEQLKTFMRERTMREQIINIRSARERAHETSSEWQEALHQHLEFIGGLPGLTLDTQSKRKALRMVFDGSRGALWVYTIWGGIDAAPTALEPRFGPKTFEGFAGIKEMFDQEDNFLTPLYLSMRHRFIEKPHEVMTGNIQSLLAGKPVMKAKRPNR